MIVPGRLTILLAVLLAILLIAAVVAPFLAPLILSLDLILLFACVLQGQKLRRLAVDVEREDWGRVQVGRPELLIFRISNRSRRELIVGVRQPWPAGVEAEEDSLEVKVAPGEVVRATLTAKPRERGSISVPRAEVTIRFEPDLARVRRSIEPAELKVFPSLRGMSEYEALRRHHASSLAGLQRHRMLGAGREFDQLRDYFPDDDFRDVNWKATARHRRPITNMYQAERSREILLCLDCGRMMGNPVGAGTALDCAIDASIMLAHVANRQGDRVGLALFGDVVHRFIKPAGGMPAVHRIIEELVDARTEPVFPSYAALVGALRAQQNQRSMVFLFTDLNDPQLATNLAEVLPLVSRRHVLVVISLRDPLLDRIGSGPAANRRGLYEAIAARQLATERATHTRELHKLGAMVVEADAGSITMKLLNTYLSIKARQLL